ncbi:SpaA isopeptide-forming pilin-related protein [Listeria aquatica]|uniref:Cell wall surface anchor family protein n=3 Tax=Listeria aquatica TaxID=1494960 RepID=W7B159_9LIST|nr:SpaA isopeptide-forming pilin-related protein [Listeria aquatica]EUJ20979.1 cell wall surface anchor family protein [Listeria aquatica FSL S10-1188]
MKVLKKEIRRISTGGLALLIVLASLFSNLGLGPEKVQAADPSDGNIHVTADNFLDYFELNGSATYEQSSGIITLTENVRNQSGNFALQKKIDTTKDFTLTGKINLGDKSNIQGGADGIGFAFHSGNTSDIGTNGGALGVGGLTGGFGWKADSHYNFEGGSNYVKDPDKFATPIPPDTSTPSFGGFVYNDNSGIAHTYEGADAPASVIEQPTSNQFKDIQFSYDGDTRTMTVTYEGKTWSKNITEWNSENSLAFIVSASTGNKYNLQQFQIVSFDYVTTGSVVLTKTDAKDSSQKLPGAEFSIQDNSGTVIKSGLTTDANGQISVDGLPFGDYQFVETKAPIGYVLDATPIPFTITSDNTDVPLEVSATNTQQPGDVTLTKVDSADNSKTLSGVEFSLQNAAGVDLQTGLVTNESGQITVQDLEPGNYQFVETKTLPGYVLDTTPHKFTITNTQTSATQIMIENTQQPGDVVLTKVDKDDATKTLSGAEFSLQDSTGAVVQTGLTTDANGQLTVKDLAPGNYQFVETKAPTGYVLDATPHEFTITNTQTEAVKVTAENTQQPGDVVLTKVDKADTSKTLAGAEFSLKNSTGITIQSDLKTNEIGQLTVKDLAPGDYQFVETKAPTGYVLDATPIDFTITNTQTSAVQVKAENTERTGDVVLKKVDSKDSSKSLESAEFSLQDATGKTIEKGLVTNAAGEISVKDLKAGDYQFVETKAPTGYVLDTTPHKFTIVNTQTEPVQVVAKNTQQPGDVVLTKVDKDDVTKALAGAEFSLQDHAGTTLQTGLVTNETGQIAVEDLEPGDYQFVETKAPVGYVLDSTPHKFTITNTQTEAVSVVIENTQQPGDVELTKVDSADSSKTLADAEFELQDNSGKTIQAKLKTDDNGKLLVKDLAPGDYQFVETKAPKGYVLDNTPHKFTITNTQAEPVQIVAKNEVKVAPSIHKDVEGEQQYTLKNKDESFDWHIATSFGNDTANWKRAAIKDDVNPILDIEAIKVVDENGKDVTNEGVLTKDGNHIVFKIAKKDGSYAFLAGHTYTMTITTKIKPDATDKQIIAFIKQGGIPNRGNFDFGTDDTIQTHEIPTVIPPDPKDPKDPISNKGALPHTGDTNDPMFLFAGLLLVAGLCVSTLKRRRQSK